MFSFPKETWFLCFNTKQGVATILKRAERAGKLNKTSRNLVFSSRLLGSGTWVPLNHTGSPPT
ncbi:hypothetical protein AVDCRST_MAG84-6704 [uncultured Microcoleus sp.]|uniref:Uncharacterized protein n=1 Tax=uncultured Microcoleus sp. TaxID=259945 RepID=A0A6J4PD02_9CYAN|nr:hypothetical protein AVDCRST_MAG84-6704 [uncultured Microcoleus sp.]